MFDSFSSRLVTRTTKSGNTPKHERRRVDESENERADARRDGQDVFTHSTKQVRLMTMTWIANPDPEIADLVPTFMQNRRVDLETLRDALLRKDFETIRRVAHTLKGICSPYGFAQLEMLAKRLEGAGIREELKEATDVLNEMQDFVENVQIIYDSP